MHIPDGFLDTKTIITTAVISGIGVGFALRNVKKQTMPQRIPLMGLVAAFVFTAQMLNFPIAGGTSGHLMGAVLASVLLGPSAAILVLTSVLLIQCFLFADGGILSLGANLLNMALVGSVGGYTIYYITHRLFPGERGRFLAVGFAAWCSTVLASICCAGELTWAGTVDWSAAFPAMANIHMLIGLGEGILTMFILAAIRNIRPELLRNPQAISEKPLGEFMLYGSLIALGLGIFVSPFISAWPDGLEKVAAQLGFEQKATATKSLSAPLSDYRLQGFSPETGTAIAAVIGMVVVFFLAYGIARLLIPQQTTGSNSTSNPKP